MMQLKAIQPGHHGRPIGYRYGCRCWACAEAHANDLRHYRQRQAGKEQLLTMSRAAQPSRDYILSLFAKLPVGEPHPLSPMEVGGEDAWQGKPPRFPHDPGYMAGYDVWLERRRTRLAIDTQKAMEQRDDSEAQHRARHPSKREVRVIF